MEIFKSHEDVFLHLLKSFEGQPIPKDIQEAKYALEGGRKYPLGEKRVKSLLLKYGGGRYKFQGIYLFED